jgi:hypothetical protein
MVRTLNTLVCAGLLLAGASGALAGFAGQPILGPLSNGSIASDTTLGKADDNDGWDSGTHIFDIWDGGDDVYRLQWLGGDMTVTLDSLGGSDNDLFIYVPGSLDSSYDYSLVGAHDVVTILGATAGDYYINVDSTAFTEGSYQLAVTPEPATLSLLGLGLLLVARVRRRA